MTLTPADVVSPWMMKLSGTVMRGAHRCPEWSHRSAPGSSWAGRPRCTGRWSSGRSGLAPEHVEARVLVGIQRLAERVQDVGAELDRVGAAELLQREADRERGREPSPVG